MTHGTQARTDVSLVPLGFEPAGRTFRWVSDPLVGRNLGLRTSPSLERTSRWIASADDDATRHPLAILLAGDHVGNVVLDRVDDYLRSARLSIYIGEPTCRGLGVGTAALHGALHEAFEVMQLNKVWLTVHPENVPAISAYFRAGFKLEGLLRDEFVLDGRRTYAVYMGILRAEYTPPGPGSEAADGR
jgi:RimJ/RimL family protein N-acetyltransferase